MTTFDNRDKSFENKFAHDEELNFKVAALASRMLAVWAAKKIGKSDAEASAYAAALIDAEFGRDGGLEGKLLADLATAGVELSPKDLQKEMANLLVTARTQISGKTN